MKRTWPQLLAAVIILVVPVWRLGADAFLDGLRAVDGRSAAAALGIGLLTTVLSAARWRLIARRLGLRLPLGAAVADYYRALFLNAVLPAGVLGDVHRAVDHGRRAGDVARGVRAVVLERAAGLAVLVAVAAAVLLAAPGLGSVHAPAHGRPVPAGAVLGIGAVLAAAAAAMIVAARRGVLGRWAARCRRVLVAAISRMGADARRGLLARDAWPGVLLLSAAALLGHVALFLVAAELAGADASWTHLLPMAILALLAMGLPVNVGGWGPREAVSALAFGAAGLPPAQGLTVAVTYGVLTLIASLPGLLVLARQALPTPARHTPPDPAREVRTPALATRTR